MHVLFLRIVFVFLVLPDWILLSPPLPDVRPPLPALYLVRPLFCPVVLLLLFLSLVLSQYLV